MLNSEIERIYATLPAEIDRFNLTTRNVLLKKKMWCQNFVSERGSDTGTASFFFSHPLSNWNDLERDRKTSIKRSVEFGGVLKFSTKTAAR